MTAPVEAGAPHYDIDPKTGERTWSGSSRSEVAYYARRLEIARIALQAVAVLSTQGSVCDLATTALEKTR